jgi:RNA recognition motif-containing protein
MEYKVFVGNLSFDTTEGEVEQLFGQAGTIVKVTLPTERETGRPRGFAFVEFDSSEAASAAIEKFDGQDLNGRPLRVNQAMERTFGGPGGGGGFGSGPGGPRPFGNDRPAPRSRPKGSRRNVRGRKRGF